MTTVERSRRHLLTARVAATLITAISGAARAQPATRGNPVIRTPARRRDSGAPPAPGAPAGGGTTGATQSPGPAPAGGAADGRPPKPGAPVAGAGAPGASDDPMVAAGVKVGAKEIDWKPRPGATDVSFNLEDADLPELVKAISNITGKRFIYGGRLRQIKATVYSPGKVSADEAYRAFLSILDANGMTVIPHGRFLKIVESPGVVTDTTPIIGPASPVPHEDRYVTRLYRLAHLDASDTANVLNRFRTKEGDITAYPPGNLLIITDTGSNVSRMLRILEEIDVGGAGEQLWVEPIHYTSASELASRLIDVLDLKGGPGAAPGGGAGGTRGAAGGSAGRSGVARIVGDDRSNSLLVTATEPDYLRLLELIKRLDVKPSGEGEIHVQYLQYATCKDISTTLNQILGTSATGGAGARFPGAAGAAPSRGATGVRGAAGSGLDEVFEGRVRLTCDEATNSIVTTSSLRDYAQLRGVIDKLDRPRRQVFIEAVIMDVSIDRKTDAGISYHGGAPVPFGSLGDGVFYGGNNITQSISGVPGNLEALAFGLRGPDIPNSQNLFGTGLSIPALGVVLHALGQDGDTNVLATPHILATDNTKAEISIGQNIPLQTNVGGGLGALAGAAGAAGGAAAGALGGLGLLSGGGGFSAPRQDVGTKITVTPHVNDSDQVRLELVEEISDAGAPTGALGAIPINKRTANTTLVVRDQQTVVIGGLVRDAIQNGETKVPILGDIPVLGLLFKQTQKTKTKSNLLLVLTPYIIRDQDDLRAIFERKMQERQEFIDRYFVFNEGTSWQPPKDYRRANGLVEDIRQQLIEEEERARLAAERAPKAKKEHAPTIPIPLPHLGGRDAGEDAQHAAPPPGAPPAPPARPSMRPGMVPRGLEHMR